MKFVTIQAINYWNGEVKETNPNFTFNLNTVSSFEEVPGVGTRVYFNSGYRVLDISYQDFYQLITANQDPSVIK